MSAARFLSCAALALSACATLPSVAQAEGLQVAPVSVAIPGRSGVVWLTNEGRDAMRAQVRVFRWSQRDGEDVLTEATDLVASPPFVSIDPGEQQVVRLVRLDASAERSCEQAFRIIVDELPLADQPAGEGLRYLMRFSIPVFATNSTCNQDGPTLTWWLEATDDGPTLVAHNSGQRSAQLADVALLDAQGNRGEVSGGLAGYVLPGQTRRFQVVSAPAFSAAGLVEVSVNGSKVIAPVSLAQISQ